MKRTSRFLLSCLLVAVPYAVTADDDNETEMKKVAGRYERFIRNAAGTTFRAVKEETLDGQSIVTTYDDVGNVVTAHTATFKLEKRGPVRVFSFFNLVVTAGPEKGHTELGTSSY